MSSTSETGHAKNVANLESLLTICTSYSSSYNPSNANITLAGLTGLLGNAKAALVAVTDAKATYDHATNDREVAFKVLSPLFTKVVNAFDACGATKQNVADARALNNKMKGVRAGKKIDPAPTDPANPPQEAPRNISVSHVSFDSKISYFESLIKLLGAEGSYAPNEPDLTLAGLSNFLVSLKTIHQTAIKAAIDLSNARINRDQVLYLSDNNLCESAQDVKKYIKSIFGAASQQYKQVGKIKFSSVPTTV